MLEHFDEVIVVARVTSASSVSGRPVEGPGVSVGCLPNYVGTRQAIRKFWPLHRAVQTIAAEPDGYFAGKLPGLVAGQLQRRARAYGRPFLANVVGDPYPVLATGTLGPAGVLAAPASRALLRRQVIAADAAMYVSESYLQRCYPARFDALQLARSDVELVLAAFASHRHGQRANEPFRLISVGSQNQLLKGHDLLIQALAGLRGARREVELHLVGSGRRQPELRQLAARLGVADRVIFHGHVIEVSRVRALLDLSNLYVQPSRGEGMPRALIEAMARELPCIGTDVGGIPELLNPEVIFHVDDLAGLVDRIEALMDSVQLSISEGTRNRARAEAVAERADPRRYTAFLARFANLGSRPSAGRPSAVRVAHLLGSLDRGGAEMRTLQLIQATDSDKVQTAVVTLSGRVGALGDAYVAAGASVYPIRIYSLAFPWRFLRFLRSHRVDVVHSNVHYSSGPLLLLARLGGVRTRIAHFRSDGPPWSELNLARRVKYGCMRAILWRNATSVIGVSPSALSAALGPTRTTSIRSEVIPNGIDLETMNPSKVRTIREAMVPAHCDPIIVHLGRADIPTKNREGAIRYFAAYRRGGGLGSLVFVGRDGASSDLALRNRRRWIAMAKRLSVDQQVVFLGERQDIASVLVSSDLLLFTSTLEGLPGAILEARAMGTPVVTSNVPGAVYLAEQLEGIHLLSVDDDDDAWVHAIQDNLLERPTATTRQASHDRMRHTVFDAATAAQKFEEVWCGHL